MGNGASRNDHRLACSVDKLALIEVTPVISLPSEVPPEVPSEVTLNDAWPLFKAPGVRAARYGLLYQLLLPHP